MKASFKHLFLVGMASSALVLVGCASETSGGSGSGSGGGGGNSNAQTTSAKAIFDSQCADCHGQGGQGGSAPNLVERESELDTLLANVTRMISTKGIECGSFGADCAAAVSDYITHSLYLSNTLPVADATASSNITGVAPLRVGLNASRSYATSGTSLAGWTWNVYDNTSAQYVDSSTTHTFTTAGTYNVQLSVMDSSGYSSAVDSFEVRVGAVEGNLPPIAFIRIPFARGFAGVAVQFDGDDSVDENKNTLLYSWTFGNGMTSSDPNPVITYVAAGDYVVELTVTDEDGNSASTQRNLRIETSADDIAAAVYADSCARCHGSQGQGGSRSRINDGADYDDVAGMLNGYASGYLDCAGSTPSAAACAQAVTDLINNIF